MRESAKSVHALERAQLALKLNTLENSARVPLNAFACASAHLQSAVLQHKSSVSRVASCLVSRARQLSSPSLVRRVQASVHFQLDRLLRG